MKKNLKLVALFAFGLLLMNSCQKHDCPYNPNKNMIHFTANELQTKSVFGDVENGKVPVLWTENTQVKLLLNEEELASVDVTPIDNAKKAEFNYKLTDKPSATSLVFEGVSPATAFKSVDKSAKTYTLELPATQTSLEKSVDEQSQIIVSKSETFTDVPEEVSLSFTHVLAYGRFDLNNIDLQGKEVKSVSLTAEKDIVGSFTYNIENAKITNVTVAKTLVINTTKTTGIYFSILPVDLSNTNIKIAVTTADDQVIEKTIGLNEKANFEAGKLTSFNINVAKTYPTELYMIGETFGSWNWADEGVVTLKQFDNKEGQYYTVKYFNANKPFKFADTKDWNTGRNFRELANNQGFEKDPNADNSIVTEDGFYVVLVDMKNDKLTIEKAQIFVNDTEVTNAPNGIYKFDTTADGELNIVATSPLLGDKDSSKAKFMVKDTKLQEKKDGVEADSFTKDKNITIDFNKDSVIAFAGVAVKGSVIAEATYSDIGTIN